MKNSLIDFIDLHKGEEDKQKVLEEVKTNIVFRNANLWILACAIVIASVGLNVNSTAVIIGAMLISPLMGPIVGAGFALGTYDFDLLKRAGVNLLVATIVSLAVATAYFFVSPFKETQSELLARTSPNIYDVLIAFFGGLVGVISLTRVSKGNPIPGVAIATALMPPLCTAGYGLAVGNFSFFLGAFFLYTINCFFICIATFFIIKYLKYPPVRSVDAKYDKQIQRIITLMIIVMIVPSFYLAYNLYEAKKYAHKVEQFIAHEFSDKGYTIIYQKTVFNANPKQIELAFLAKKLTNEEISSCNKKMSEYGIENTQLIIKQETRDLKSEILREIGNQNKNISVKDIEIQQLKMELALYKFDNDDLAKEMGILFPELRNISLGRHSLHANTDSAKTVAVLVYQVERPENGKKTEPIDYADKLKPWLEHKLGTKDIRIVEQE